MPLAADLLALLRAATRREGAHLDAARREVLAQYRKASQAELVAQLRAALDLPTAQRRAQLPALLRTFDRATQALRQPPTAITRIIREAVRDRVLSVDDLSRFQDPALRFNDSAELQARAVGQARRDMNRYWDNHTRDFRNDVAKTIRETLRRGLSHEQAVALLQQRTNVSRSRAVLIVQDQLLTAAANAARQRQLDLGITEYQWVTRGDDRVRQAHQARAGHRYRWADGGEYPGQAIRCRCTALPVLRVERLQASVPELPASLADMTAPLPRREAARRGGRGLPVQIARRPAGHAPAGAPLSDLLDLPYGSDFDVARSGLATIARTHGAGPLRRVPVRLDPRMDLADAAAYEPETRDGNPRAILLNPRARPTPLEFVHEIGHYLDHQGLGVPGQYASTNHPDLEEWRQAVRQSPTLRRLNSLRMHEAVEFEGELQPVEQARLGYLLREREVFARSYTQFVAASHGDAVMRREIGSRVDSDLNPVLYPEHWNDEEFEPIARAIERLLVKKGWMQ